MRLVSYEHGGTAHVGVREGDIVVPLGGIDRIGPQTPLALLRAAPRLREQAVALDSVRLLPAVPAPEKIVCVGLNYRAHQAESRRADTDYPVLFAKFAGSLIGARDDILRPPEAEFFDYEAELAVVIGKAGRRIPEDRALDHVLGLSVANDITVRDYQYRTHQWLQGKTWDGTTPLGPDIVTLDEADPSRGRIRCVVNGRTEQDADLSQLIFTVPFLIATVSEFTELVPGDVILTGTPGGVGYRREPPLNLQDGDTVTVEIESVGSITNTVRAQR